MFECFMLLPTIILSSSSLSSMSIKIIINSFRFSSSSSLNLKKRKRSSSFSSSILYKFLLVIILLSIKSSSIFINAQITSSSSSSTPISSSSLPPSSPSIVLPSKVDNNNNNNDIDPEIISIPESSDDPTTVAINTNNNNSFDSEEENESEGQIKTPTPITNSSSSSSSSTSKIVDTTQPSISDNETNNLNDLNSSTISETTTTIDDVEEEYNDPMIILNLNSSLNNVLNCSDVKFYCEMQSLMIDDAHHEQSSSSPSEARIFPFNKPDIWWTFRGENVSAKTLPGGRVIYKSDQPKISILDIECAQFGIHDGEYQCHHSEFIPIKSPSVSSSINNNGSQIKSIIIDSPSLNFEIQVLNLESIPTNRTIWQEIDTELQLKCHALGHPKPKIEWQRYDPNTLIITNIEPDGRISFDNQTLPDVHNLTNLDNPLRIPLKSSQSILKFEQLKRSDNGSYVCKAYNSEEKPKTQEFNVIVLEVPEIHIEKIEIENKTSALVSFVVDFDGNLPIEQYNLELRNFTEENSTWIPISSSTIFKKNNYFTIKVDDLIHAAQYGFRLSAKNGLVGQQSEWNMMNITVPADVPSPINNIHLLSKSNETLLFGWRRPLHDNGAAIIYFEQILKLDQNDVIIWNQTINNTQSRNKHMSLFSNLQPGTKYLFQIRACSQIGCGEWSPPFEALTSDGHSDPPLNIRLECLFDFNLIQTNGTIRWDPPSNPRGSIIGYNISLRGHSIYSNNRQFDTFEQSYQVQGNETFKLKVVLKPNSNYTTRLCAINKSGCGQLSHLTTSSMCQTSPTGPSEFPEIILQRMGTPPPIGTNLNQNNNHQISPFLQERQLKVLVPKISERNGSFLCVRIIVIRLPNNVQSSSSSTSTPSSTTLSSSSLSSNNSLPLNQTNTSKELFIKYLNGTKHIPLMTYRMVHDKSRNSEQKIGAYIAKEFKSENFPQEIIIGDGKVERCYDDALEYDLKSRVKHTMINGITNSFGEDSRSPRRINFDLKNNNDTIDLFNEILDNDGHLSSLVENRELWPNTFYSVAVEVTVMAINHTLLVNQSKWAQPIATEPIVPIIPQLRHSLSEATTGILYGTFCSLLLIMVLFFSVLCFIKRKASEQSTPVLLNDERIGLTSFIRRNIIGGTRKRKDSAALFYQLNFNSTNAIRKWASKPIPIQTLVAVFQQRRTNSDFLFQAEFEALPETFPDRTTIASDAEENVGKNRYPDIKSYDQTRVKLSLIDDNCDRKSGDVCNGDGDDLEDGDGSSSGDDNLSKPSDYINADYVNGFKDEKRFICAQGPLPKTIPDFWRMIYEQKSSIIVMLTGIEEQGRIKCAQYWNDDKSVKFEDRSGRFEIITEYRREYSDYVIRKFQLKNLKTEELQEVLHFHFIAWRDFLAPEQPSWLLRFIKRVNEHYCPDHGPIVVHCSAGVGRTGTFIAIDTLISQIDDGAQEINIFECVSKLRYQRNYLVQSLRQYIFVYRAIMEYVEFGDTEIEATHIRDHYKQLKEQKSDSGNGVFAEFEKLNEVFEPPKSCIVGSMEANKNKNRYPFIIPYDFNRVILNPSQDACYINASFIQGYDHKLSFIVAQDPLEHTVNEFWWMIIEHGVNTIVMLSELGDGQNKCYCYWPSSVDETYDCDFFKVKLIEEEIYQYFIKRVFDVTRKKTNKTQTVNQYQFLSWKSGVVVPESTISLITLTDVILFGQNQVIQQKHLPSTLKKQPSSTTANNNNVKHVSFSTPETTTTTTKQKIMLPDPSSNQTLSATPILVHCSGGGDRSSVFVSFASLVKQLHLEERVDVFQTARYTKSQRHCMLQTIAQYDFLYRCLIDYMDCHSIYDNSDTQL